LEGVPDGKAFQEVQEAVHLLVDGCILLVGADDILALPPECVHRVQVRRTLGNAVEAVPHALDTGVSMTGLDSSSSMGQKASANSAMQL